MKLRGVYAGLFLIVFGTILANPILAVDQVRGGPVEKPVVDKIYVSLTDFRLIALHNDKILFEFPVTIGADTGPTPTGKFTVTSRLKHPWYTPDDKEPEAPGSSENPLGNRWIGISKPSYGIHGTNNPDVLETKASEGCVRLHNSDVAKLYRHVDKETPVIIKRNLPFDYSKLLTAKHEQENRDQVKQES